MKCPNCGQELEDPNQDVCQYCGAKVSQDVESVQSTVDKSVDKNTYKTEKKSTYTKYNKKKYYPFVLISIFLIMGAFIALGFYSYLDFLIGLSEGMENVIGPPFYIVPIILNIIGLVFGVIAGLLRRKWEKKNQSGENYGTILILIIVLVNIIGIVVGGILLAFQF